MFSFGVISLMRVLFCINLSTSLYLSAWDRETESEIQRQREKQRDTEWNRERGREGQREREGEKNLKYVKYWTKNVSKR